MSKLVWHRLLVFFCVALVLLFQVFWLYSEYKIEKRNLSREVSHVLRTTYFPAWNSENNKEQGSFLHIHSRNAQIRILLDSSKSNSKAKASVPDSLQTIALSPLSDTLSPFYKNFILKDLSDPAERDTLTKKYRKNLQEEGLPHAFSIQKYKRNPDGRSPEVEQLVSASLPGKTITEGYRAYFSNYNTYILQQMVPQFLFALGLVGVIVAAFSYIMRTLAYQQKLVVLKDELVSNISHELKTPVTTVSLALEALQGYISNENAVKALEYVDIARQEMNRLHLLVEKTLQSSIHSQKGIQIHKETIDLADLVLKVTNSMMPLLEKTKAVVRVEVSDRTRHPIDLYVVEYPHAVPAASEEHEFIPDTETTCPVLLYTGDSIHISNVVYNLLDNAIKYNKQEPAIDVLLHHKGNSIDLIVQDNGIGIEKGDQKRIFDKFYRVPTPGKHNVKGHGLGLSYVQSVVQQHGGTIRVESNPGEGSRFSIQLSVTPI